MQYKIGHVHSQIDHRLRTHTDFHSNDQHFLTENYDDGTEMSSPQPDGQNIRISHPSDVRLYVADFHR